MYIIEEVNSDNVRIINDQNKLKWYAALYFDQEKQPDITSIIIDDQIENIASDCIEVTIEFSDKKKYWTKFTTPEYLRELLRNQTHISSQNLIIISELSEQKMKEIVLELDKHNELIDHCKNY